MPLRLRSGQGPGLLDWLDSRTGYRRGARRLLDEPLPHGVGWWFVTGSILLFLLVVQLLTGLVLAMYYVPAPEHAYDSVRFITDRLAFGSIVRGLHFFGASFIVVAAVVHMLRVVLFGSYKKPREVTWMTGVVLLLVILAFALSGYLLPWDQKAYWATTVTINIARHAPLVGEQVASLLRGGLDLGALTLSRWYAAHVLLLPAALAGFVVAHLYLMRRHGISGPLRPVPGEPAPFYPYHAIKDTLAVAAVFGLLLTMAILVPAPLDELANPTDATYVPRPEWYFLSLFQLLKYFPGPLEPIASIVIPGLIVLALVLLPFIDRTADRHPLKRPFVTGGFAVLGVALVALTWLGLQDSPAHADPAHWGPIPIAGRLLVQDDRCVSCHRTGGIASPIEQTRLRRDPEWLFAHVADPEIIAPGIREAPAGGMNRLRGDAIHAYMRKLRAGAPPPATTRDVEVASLVFATRCANCHVIDGAGVINGPELSHVGRTRDAKWLRAWITDPVAIDEDTEMPAFGDRLSEAEMTSIVTYLAARK